MSVVVDKATLRAVEHYDVKYLMDLAREECEEFCLAVSHLQRKDRPEPWDERLTHLLEEATDAAFALRVLGKKLAMPEVTDAILERKARRWIERMDKEGQ